MLPTLLALSCLILCLTRENDAVTTWAHHLYPSTADLPDQDFKLMDIVLLASNNGKFHALNSTSGHILQSMVFTAFFSSVPPALGPVVHIIHRHHINSADNNGKLYIIESQFYCPTLAPCLLHSQAHQHVPFLLHLRWFLQVINCFWIILSPHI